MKQGPIDTTNLSNEAEKAAAKFDAVKQFGVPDLAKWLQTAYYHGYRDALIQERVPALRR